MKLTKRSVMRIKDLRNVNARQVATFNSSGYLKQMPGKTADFAAPGFYFLVRPNYGTVAARFFVGIQRSKSGFANTAAQLRLRRTGVGQRIMNFGKAFDVYFLPIESMKPITTGFSKGKFAMLMTSRHTSKYQTMDELNRMLNDNFKFSAQSY